MVQTVTIFTEKIVTIFTGKSGSVLLKFLLVKKGLQFLLVKKKKVNIFLNL